jgi:hypothetical protein
MFTGAGVIQGFRSITGVQVCRCIRWALEWNSGTILAQDCICPGLVQGYRVLDALRLQEYMSGTCLVQGCRSSTGVLGCSITVEHWCRRVQMYRDICVVQVYRSTGVGQVYRCIGVLQEDRCTGEVTGSRGTGVLQGYSGTGIVMLCRNSRRYRIHGYRSSTRLLQVYRCRTVIVVQGYRGTGVAQGYRGT